MVLSLYLGTIITTVSYYLYMNTFQEQNEVTLYLRPIIFYGIPIGLIQIHGYISRIVWWMRKEEE